ncbi:MAG TPA: DUF2169 domain-containing protein [Rhodothermales bacterium]|nr:DUF2169 domain-containing protein [Rhodothermales bacterium]
MDLVNSTPIPAELLTSSLPGIDVRPAALLAKATFRVEHQAPVLERQNPRPLVFMDEETDLGLIPRDDLVRPSTTFEVILLGAAYTPDGRPAPATMVSLSVGAVQRQLLVVGDRHWGQGFGQARPTDPVPFERMPMTWAQAFGGATTVEIDKEASVEVMDARNRLGRGFDPRPQAEGIARALESPNGYPVFDETRLLPNLENPQARIMEPDDNPDPLCWATMPPDSGLHAARAVEGLEGPEDFTHARLLEQEAATYRAHPDWVIALPPERAMLTLQNATPDGRWAFALPPLRVLFDYTNNGRTTTRDLIPQMMVLYPEEGLFTITYRKPFTFPFEEGAERAVRLRIEEGWYVSADA